MPRDVFRVTAVVPGLASAKFLCGDFAPHAARASTCPRTPTAERWKRSYVIILSARMVLDFFFLRVNVLGVSEFTGTLWKLQRPNPPS